MVSGTGFEVCFRPPRPQMYAKQWPKTFEKSPYRPLVSILLGSGTVYPPLDPWDLELDKLAANRISSTKQVRPRYQVRPKLEFKTYPGPWWGS